MGGATADFHCYLFRYLISIHAPCGGSDSLNRNYTAYTIISIHAPRGGSDWQEDDDHGRCGYFNPRSPWGERPVKSRLAPDIRNFNPRSPWGERPQVFGTLQAGIRFQSTLPVGGATLEEALKKNAEYEDFNPRSPWGERPSARYQVLLWRKFQSTLPVGGATNVLVLFNFLISISIHAPRGGSDDMR